MLTPKNIKAKTAIEYFKEGYYQKGKWLGKGATVLGLKGEIKNNRVYENIVKGLSPDGSKRLNKREVHSDKRKAAVDCTFAAPKSVSLCALVGGNERLIQAHQRAVEKVLELMEAKYAQSRVMLDGETQEVVKTGNLVIAKYDHIESRDLDPHLHSHCLVMNMTQLPNGEWYSHLNDEIFRNQKLLGMTYQHYLALEVQKLGYEIELKDHGQFDIKGYSESDLNDFSKRRMQILALAGADASSVEREKAWSKTRRNKENVTLEELLARWQQEAAVLGIEIVSPGVSKPEAVSNQVEPKIFADAIRYCSERQVAFRAEEIQAFILSESKPLDIATIEPLINSSDQLIRIQEQNGLRYTTMAAVERELATINLMKAGQGKVSAISHPEIVEAHLAKTSLNEGQRQAVMMTLGTSDQFIAWQGVAGAGKTFALKLVLSLAQKQGYSVLGFAPSAKASTVLGQELAAQTQTVARLLASKSPDQIEPKQIWIVDEAGLLSAKDAFILFQRATRELARVILVGDTKQLSAVEAGNPFKSLQQAGIETAYLNESQRQKDSPQLKVAIDLLAQGRVEAGFARLCAIECIQKVTKETKTEEIVKAYLQTPTEQRAKTLVLAGTNVERLELTLGLRKALQAEGSLGSDVTLTQLKSKDLREVQLGYTSHFAVGDLVMPLRNYKRKGLEKGELYEVIGTTTDTIMLKASDGKELNVSLDFKKAVYQREQIEIAVGDRLVWKKNDHQKGQVNGKEVTVVAINGNAVKVIDPQGKTQTLDLTRPHHLDHGIVRTTFSAQGETADCVFVAADSTIGKESFYVASSRARSKLRFFTTNENELLQWAIRSRAQENPLELIRNQVQQQQLEQLVVVGQPSTASNISASSAPPVTRKATKHEASPTEHSTPLPVKQTSPVPHQPTRSISSALTPLEIPKSTISIVPFWIPTRAGVSPRRIEQKHWRELVEGSAINPALVEANVYSVAGRGVYERLLSTKVEQIGGSGQYVTQPTAKLMKAYEQVADGGWWAESGIDARSLPDLKPGEKPSSKLWGCFKADNPRIDGDKSQRKGKTEYIKYEHPLAEERQLFLFDVPDALAQRIYDKYGVQPTDAEKQSGFWYIIHKYNLPITLAEGAKKTLSSLSQGEITIGLSGVNGGYFAKDNQKNKLRDRILHPELKIFATPGREFKFAFDQDTKQSTIWNVRRDMVRTGELLELEGCSVGVVQWQGEKGLDDLIVNQGALAYAMAQANSIPLVWEAQKHYRGEYSRLARKVRDSQPTLKDEAVDVEIYKLARLKGDVRDGARTIAQSDIARLFRATLPQDEAWEKTLSYIQEIEKSISVQARHIQPEQQQQPVIQSKPNQTNEAHYGIIEASRPELADTADTRDERNRLADREDHAVGSQQYQTDGEDQRAREQQHAPVRENYPHGIESDAEPKRIESQFHELLAAIGGYLELQEIEQLGADIARINQSLTTGRLPGRGATQFTRAVERQDSTNVDSAASYGSIEQQTIADRAASRECLNALANYVEAVSIESSPLAQSLQTLVTNLNRYQHQDLAGAMQELETAISNQIKQPENSIEHTQTQAQTINAIAQYLEHKFVEAPLVQNLQSLIQKLTALETQVNQQVIEAIANHIEVDSVEANITQTLESLTKRISQLPDRKFTALLQKLSANLADKQTGASLIPINSEQSRFELENQCLDAIADFGEGEALTSSTVISALSGLKAQLSVLENKQPHFSFEVALSNYLQQLGAKIENLQQTSINQAVEAVSDFVEQSAIESGIDLQSLQALSTDLSQFQHGGVSTQVQQLEAIVSNYQTHLQALAQKEAARSSIEAFSNYCDTAAIDSAIAPTIEPLRQQLAALGNSSLPEQLQQLQAAIEQHKPLVLRQTTAQLPPQVFMGSQPQPQKFQPIQNHGAVYKPAGGMWTSPYQLQYGSEWSAFVHKEGMTVPPHKQHLWLVVPKPDLKVLVVDSPEKLKSLPHLPPRIIGDNVCPLNYEAIASRYDALVIKPQMLRGCMEVASFDIESTIWFGSRGYPFASVELLMLPKVQQQVSLPTVDSSPNQSSTLTSKNNGQASVGESETVKNLEKWKLVAIALGKPQSYINRVAATTKAVKTGLPLPENAFPFMQQDFQFYQQISDDLQRWYDTAQDLGKSDQYLSHIKQVAKAFHDPSMPTPLSPKAVSTMQQELQKHEQLQMHSLWQHYSLAVEPIRPMMKANAVAHAALIDGHPTELIHKLLKHDPQLPKIRLSGGEQAVQNHLKVSLQSALSKMQQQNQLHQVYQQHQHKQTPVFEL